MEWDSNMFYETRSTDGYEGLDIQTAVVQACNLNEELGQIEYVFSDKTGTLTCNQMIFRRFTAGLRAY